MSTDATQLLTLAVKTIIEQALDEREPVAKTSPVATEPLDASTREQIAQYALLAHKPYLTKKEAAIYLGVSERSIAEWAARPPDKNPFPESAAGSDPRFKRERIDEWAAVEGQRRRLKGA